MKIIVKEMVKNCVLVTLIFYGTLLIMDLINMTGNLVFKKNWKLIYIFKQWETVFCSLFSFSRKIYNPYYEEILNYF